MNYIEKNYDNGRLECTCIFPNSTNWICRPWGAQVLKVVVFLRTKQTTPTTPACPTASITFKISLLAIVVEPTTCYSILVEDLNLGTFTTMHNQPNVCEEKAKKGRIST